MPNKNCLTCIDLLCKDRAHNCRGCKRYKGNIFCADRRVNPPQFPLCNSRLEKDCPAHQPKGKGT